MNRFQADKSEQTKPSCMVGKKGVLGPMGLGNSVMFARTKVLGRSMDPVLNPPVFPLPLLFTVHMCLSPGFLDSFAADEVWGPEQLLWTRDCPQQQRDRLP